MFKRLRNRFLILNMIMISILLIGSFGVVFFMVYEDTNRGIDADLEMGLRVFQPGAHRGISAGSGDMTAPFFGGASDRVAEHDPPPERKEIASVRIDNEGNIIEIRSSYEYDSEFYGSVISAAFEKLSESCTGSRQIYGYIRVDDSGYKYLLDAGGVFVAEAESNTYCVSVSNIDTQISMLETLAVTLGVVLIAALVIVFLICLYFANRSIRPIEEAWEKQNRFIADASHELKTPLTTINTNADVLLAHSGDSIESHAKWIHYIKDETERMSKLTNDLLYLAKVGHSSDKKQIKTLVSFSSALESIILTMEAVIFEKKLRLDSSIESGVEIFGDGAQIKQLILILIDNAVKYTPQDGVIEISLKKSDGKAVLKVKNTGDGIPREDLNKIFDRFYRSDKSRARKSGGYGLGLAIARSIVSAHRGTISVKSEPHMYTEFIVEIPAARKK